MKLCAALVALAATCSFCAVADAAVYNFFDTTFVNADWIGVKYADTSTPTGSFTAGSTNPGGSALLPGPQTADYRAITHNFGGGSAGAIVVTHEGVNDNWAPLPLETATTVDYSYDLNFFDPSGTFGAVGFSPAIFQGGSVFRLPAYDNVFGPTGWQRFSGSGISILSFVKIDPATAFTLPGSVNPAAAMSFGFVSANSANQFVTKNSGIDDFRFTLNTVPEPGSLASLAALALHGRRRRARSAG
jgi:hypothetical protein